MFSGIIEGTRPVARIQKTASGAIIAIDLAELAQDAKPGDSIAIDGVCLTVVEIEKGVATFDIMQETLRKTTLGFLKPNMLVNVEHSIRADSRIHGHFVQGHVFGLGTITKKITKNEYQLWIKAGTLMKYVVPVGSIAVNGVSLTIADVTPEEFMISLIPVTLNLTNLGSLQEGDTVNLEPDMVSRQIVHFLERRPAAVLGVK